MSRTTAESEASSRKLKWHPTPPPPPTPKILNLPRRIRHRKPHTKPTKTLQNHHSLLGDYYYSNNNSERKEKLQRLFGEEEEEERELSMPIVLLRRGRVENEVEEVGDGDGDGGGAEEKWKFQAEMLRAECNFLRKERELALKKLEKNNFQMQKTLTSALQTLISEKKKIFEGKNVSGGVLEEEIDDLAEKLAELQRNSGIKDFEFRKCSNFDKKAGHLQRRLEKLGGGLSDVKFSNHENDKESRISSPRNQNESADVETLRWKMEGLSKEMWDKLEEDFGSMLSNTANSSVASSASTSKRIECLPGSALYQEDGKCSGRCKAIVRKVVEQVRAETEQWSQMQGMLGKVREEMEELQACRNFWEDQALNSDCEIKRLHFSVQEWKEKALNYEIKADELAKELSALRGELEKLNTAEKSEQRREVTNNKTTSLLPLSKHLVKENYQTDDKESNDKDVQPPISLGKQLEKEKRLLLQRLKEKRQAKENIRKQETDCRTKPHSCNNTGLATVKRSPFRDIGNSSPLMKQSRIIFPL